MASMRPLLVGYVLEPSQLLLLFTARALATFARKPGNEMVLEVLLTSISYAAIAIEARGQSRDMHTLLYTFLFLVIFKFSPQALSPSPAKA